MTLDLYGHLYGDQLDELGDRLDAAVQASRKAGVAPVFPEPKLINLDSARDEHATQQIRAL